MTRNRGQEEADTNEVGRRASTGLANENRRASGRQVIWMRGREAESRGGRGRVSREEPKK